MDLRELRQRIIGESGEFVSHLSELVKEDRIEDEIALGIARFIIANGPESLSDKQWYTFINKGLIEHNYIEECERCFHPVPWTEMFGAVYFYEDSYCSYCRHLLSKDD